MNVIDLTTPEKQPSSLVMRRYSRREGAKVRDTAVMRVRDFTALMKIIAANDLWDALEAQMAAQSCTNFRVGAEPMRIASAVLRRNIEQGKLLLDTPGLFAACSSLGGGSDEGEAADAGGKQGGAAGAAGTAENAKGGEVLGPGESGGSKDKPQ